MERKINDVLGTMEMLERLELFDDMNPKELRELAVELVKIDTIDGAGKSVSNAVSHVNYPNV